MPRDAKLRTASLLIPLAGFIGIFCLVIPIITRYPKLQFGWPALALIIPVSAVAVVSTYWTARRLTFWSMSKHKASDLVGLAAPAPSDQYVGIAYTEGDWAFRGDTSWDRGWIGVHGDALVFSGFGPRFSLPVSLIENFEERQTRSINTNSLPRVYVTWHDLTGVRNTFSLDIRDAGNRQSTILETRRLGMWLRESLAAAGGEVANEAGALPFRSAELDFRGVPSGPNVRLNDKVVAIAWGGAVAFAGGAVLGGIEKLTHMKLSIVSGLLGAVAMAVANGVLLRRVQARQKALS